MKDPEVAYERRVDWYNKLMTKVNEYAQQIVSVKEREKVINEFLTKAIENLHKTVDPGYLIANDPDTKKRLAEISKQIAEKRGTNLRKGAGEERRNNIKSFTSFFLGESISDFFDNRHKAIIAKQEINGMAYRTEPEPVATERDKPAVQPQSEATKKRKAPASSTGTTKVSTTTPASAKIVDTNPGKAPSSGATRSKSRSESGSVVGAEKEKTGSVTETEKPKRKAISNTSVARSGDMSVKKWDEAVNIESRRVAEIGKEVISASSRSGTSDKFKKMQATLVTNLFDNTHVNAAVKADRKREEELGSKEAVREDKARRAREEMVRAANSKAASVTVVHPSRTPASPKSGTSKGK
jgi:hypothetical protein